MALSRKSITYLKEHPKISVSLHFLLQSLIRRRQLPNIRGVCQSELGRRIKEDIPDPGNNLALLSLSNIHRLEQVSVTFTQVKDITKHFFDEFVGAALNDRRIRVS